MLRFVILTFAVAISLPIFGSEIDVAQTCEDDRPVLLAEMKIAEERSQAEEVHRDDLEQSPSCHLLIDCSLSFHSFILHCEHRDEIEVHFGLHSSRAPPIL